MNVALAVLAVTFGTAVLAGSIVAANCDLDAVRAWRTLIAPKGRTDQPSASRSTLGAPQAMGVRLVSSYPNVSICEPDDIGATGVGPTDQSRADASLSAAAPGRHPEFNRAKGHRSGVTADLAGTPRRELLAVRRGRPPEAKAA